MTMPTLAPSSPRHPKRWLLLPVTINVYLPFSAVDDASFTYTDTTTGIAYPDVNYFVLKGNTLSMSAEQGVLKNDAAIEFVPYLTAVQQGDGEYGTFAISASGAFTYTPYSWVFDSPLFTYMGLEDTCQYAAMDPAGNTSTATVTVDLAEVVLQYWGRTGFEWGYKDAGNAISQFYVGEKFDVRATVNGQVNAPFRFSWEIGGDYFESWDASAGDPMQGYAGAHSTVIPVSDDEHTESQVDFHWVDGGTHNVTVTAFVMGNAVEDSVDVEVNRPSYTYDAIMSDHVEYRNDLFQLYDTGNGREGIEFMFSSAIGTTQIVQVVASSVWNVTYEEGVTRTWDHDGAIDTLLPYPLTADSPNANAWGNAVDIYRVDNFETTLMWKSSRLGSEWVPLSIINWEWGVHAVRGPDNVWSQDDIDWETSFNSSAYDTTSFPEWDSNIAQFTLPVL